MDVREQRARFVVAAFRREKSLEQLCQEFGISRTTGYVWLERYREDGIGGIAERSRRPLSSPTRAAPDLELRVVQARGRYPDWGARKLKVLLARDGLALTRSTIHRILLRHELVRNSDRHPPATQRFERSAPNELWQMDFKGPKHWSQPVGPLSVLDDHSRYVPVLEALGTMRTEPVRERLAQAFTTCGVPDGMLMDHGTPWWGMQSPGGLTALSIWLMKQGIRLHWSRIRHPQTQGKVERFHGELQRAIDARDASREEPQAWLDAFRWEHNYVRPHEALGMRTPSEVWHRSERRYDPQPPPWEYPSGSKVLKVDSQGKVDAWGQRWRIAIGLSGQRVQLVRLGERAQVYYCNTLIRELDLETHRSTIVERCISDPVPQR